MISQIKPVDLKGKHLIIPSVSVGNVGQLVADLVIGNLRMEKFASIWDCALVPVIGPNPYTKNSKSVSTACDFYHDPNGSKFVVVQIRSGVHKKFAAAFLNKIVEYFIGNGVDEVTILAGSFSYQQRSVESSPFRYFANSFLYEKNEKKLRQLNWIPLNHDEKPLNIKDNLTAPDDKEIDSLIVDGGGFAVRLLKLFTEKKVRTMLITKYLSEGDNIPDSMSMLSFLNDYATIFQSLEARSIVFPPSWDLLFGGLPPDGVY